MLSIIVPTYNEARNIEELLTRLFSALKPNYTPYEVLVIDDNSPDGTARIAEALKSKFDLRVVNRPRKISLASAVINGFKLAAGDILCVMDADLSHPPEAIPEMYKVISGGDVDIVIGSRCVEEGGATNWPWYRRFGSTFAQLLARPVTRVNDSTSGFFMIKKSVLEGADINPIGFKILLEILAKGNYSKVKEVPIVFNDRGGGKSKLGMRQTIEYLKQLGLIYHGMFTGKIKRRNKIG
ncbi:MAG: polyprenol monophosphomannose synthase [bacterium]